MHYGRGSKADLNNTMGRAFEARRAGKEKRWGEMSRLFPKLGKVITMAAKAGEIGVLAARAFTRGMRTTYFALASAAWLLGPWALIAATLATVAMLWRREFTSASRATCASGSEASRPTSKRACAGSPRNFADDYFEVSTS